MHNVLTTETTHDLVDNSTHYNFFILVITIEKETQIESKLEL